MGIKMSTKMNDDYRLIGGITIRQIINCLPMFDALTADFWKFADDYIPKDVLSDDDYNQEMVKALKTNFWFRNWDEVRDWQNNGLSISYVIADGKLQSLSIGDNSNQQLFSLSL